MRRWAAGMLLLAVGCRGAAGTAGKSCHVEQGEHGEALVRCDDGSGAVVKSGSDGKACTVDSLAPGEWRLSCPDGTSVVLHDGGGCTLKTGDDGTQKLSCADGSEVAVGNAPPRCTYAGAPKLLNDGFPTKDASSSINGIVSGPGSQLFTIATVGVGTNLHGQLFRSRDDGASWDLIDDFVPAGGTGSLGNGLAISPEGVIYTGFVEKPSGLWHVRRSLDDGATFADVDHTIGGFTLRDVAAGENGLVLAGGRTGDSYTVRVSDDYGETWRTADKFDPDGRQWGEAAAVRVTKSGLFAVGVVQIAGVQHWLVRRSRDGGRSFQTVDDYVAVRTGAYASGIVELADGTLLVIGDGRLEDDRLRGHVRRSLDGGRTWSTVASDLGKLNGVAVDPLGRLLLFGAEADAAGQVNGIIYASTDGGLTLTTHFTASYSLPTGFGGHDQPLGMDSQGGLWLPAAAMVSATQQKAMLFHWDCR